MLRECLVRVFLLSAAFSPSFSAYSKSKNRCARPLNAAKIRSAPAIDLSLTREFLTDIHSRYLPPREARVATELRLLHTQEELNPDQSSVLNFAMPDFQAEYDAFVSKIEEYQRFWKSYDWRKASEPQKKQKYEAAYEKFSVFHSKVLRRGFVTYGDLLSLISFSSFFCDESAVFSEIDFTQAEKTLLPIVELPLLNARGAHLGFRAINDRMVVAVGLVERPRLRIGRRLGVDAQKYSYGKFIWHDHIHSENLARAIGSETGAGLVHDADKTFAAKFLEYLQWRVARYERVREYIDAIQERRRQVLAEGIWFLLDHENNYAYQTSPYVSQEYLRLEIYNRFRDSGDLGQAFRDPSWVTPKDVNEIVDHFVKITKLKIPKWRLP